MPLKGKYIKYSQEITLEIFTLIYNKLINSGWTECSNKIIELSYSQFKTQYNHLTHQQDKIFNTHVRPYKKEYAETTVQEILGYDPFVKEFVFPEKWYVRVSDKNVKDIQLFKSKSNWSDNAAKYKAVGYEGVGYNNLPENYTEITFDQFQKYVLKGIVEMPEVKEVIPEYVECINSAGTVTLKVGMIYRVLSKGVYSCGTSWYLLEDVNLEKRCTCGNSAPSNAYNLNRFKPSTKEAFDAQNKPRQQLKQAVHCKTQEEYKAVKEFYNSQNYGGHFYKKNDCIPLDNPTQTAYKDYYVNNNYKLLSFQEWCDLNGYKMEKEAKSNQEFKVDDYVIITKSNKNWTDNMDKEVGKIVKIISITSGMYINYAGKPFWSFGARDGHFRHATPEEINNHLISIGQIPIGIQSGSTSDNAYNHLISYGNKIHEEFFNPTVKFERDYGYTVNPKYKQEFNIINKTKTIKF